MNQKILEFNKDNIEILKAGYNIEKQYSKFQITNSIKGVKIYFNKTEYPIILENISQIFYTSYIDSITLDKNYSLTDGEKIIITYQI